MYIPTHFREDDLPTLQQFMRDYSFATLVTTQDGLPFATHLPFLYHAEPSPYGALLAHMARANPHWRSLNPEQEALVIFQGPHAYITPSWYEVELSVPTWNYAAVHAYGLPRLIEDPDELYACLKELIHTHEAQFKTPWPFDLPADYLQKMMRGTVGFNIQITRLEGKFKMSQNRSTSERATVAHMLEASADPTNAAVAHLVRRVPLDN